MNCENHPKLKGLKFVHLNITSLPKHIDELKLFLQKVPFEMLRPNETRLDETIPNIMSRPILILTRYRPPET